MPTHCRPSGENGAWGDQLVEHVLCRSRQRSWWVWSSTNAPTASPASWGSMSAEKPRRSPAARRASTRWYTWARDRCTLVPSSLIDSRASRMSSLSNVPTDG